MTSGSSNAGSRARGYRFFMPQVRGGIDGDGDTSPFWTGDHVFPDVTRSGAPAIEHAEMVDYIPERQPDARIWVRTMLNPSLGWRRTSRPDELLLNSYGIRYENPSLASDSYNEQIAVYLDRRILTFHSVHTGTRRLTLPESTDVWDLIGQKWIGRSIRSISVTVDPPQTNMYRLGEES